MSCVSTISHEERLQCFSANDVVIKRASILIFACMAPFFMIKHCVKYNLKIGSTIREKIHWLLNE